MISKLTGALVKLEQVVNLSTMVRGEIVPFDYLGYDAYYEPITGVLVPVLNRERMVRALTFTKG